MALPVTPACDTMPREVSARIMAGEPMPGLMAIPDERPIAQAMEQWPSVVECREENALDKQALSLPLGAMALGYPQQRCAMPVMGWDVVHRTGPSAVGVRVAGGEGVPGQCTAP